MKQDEHQNGMHTPPFQSSAGGFGAWVEWHTSVPSTMPLAHNWAARSEIPSGAVVIADEQTAGRGRMGRRWISPPGRSLMASFLLRSSEHPIPVNRLGMVTAIGVLGACRAAVRDEASLLCKWPNDMIALDVEGTPRKIGGILIESSITSAQWSHAVIGIGINVNHTQEELPVVTSTALAPWSLRLAVGGEGEGTPRSDNEIDRVELFALLCTHLNRAAALSSEEIFEAWRDLLWVPSREVALWQGDRQLARGHFAGVDEEGQLLLQESTGKVTAWSAVDLSLRLG